jgi:hypothetical protein
VACRPKATVAEEGNHSAENKPKHRINGHFILPYWFFFLALERWLMSLSVPSVS